MNFLRKIAYLLPLALTWAACDTVDEADRFDGPLSVEARKNVLIEDFTGQRCANCPRAAETIVSLQEAYGAQRVIAVAIHGGSLALNENSSAVGLGNDQSFEYNTHWRVESWPKGWIDRTGGLLDYEKWGSAVIERLGVTPKVDIATPAASYDASSRQLTLSVSLTAAEAVTGRLQVWLTESGITRIQAMPDGQNNRNYVHNHVFRASVSAPYGDEMTLAGGEAQTKTYTYTLREDWQAEKMDAVVFFYNDADGVMQVVDTKIETNID